MPATSTTLQFYNPYITRNQHVSQPSFTMPQMVNGQQVPPVLTVYSDRINAAGYYSLGSVQHTISYTIEGSFRGTITIQYSNFPNPQDTDWTDIPETQKYYYGLETTGSAGISGGFSGAISHPTQTDLFNFVGNYAYLRARLDISQGTVNTVRYNF